MLPSSIYHPVRFYLIVIFVALALCPIAAYFSQHKGLEKFQFPLIFLAISVPCITALAMIYTSGDKTLIADFWSRLLLFKISAPYLLFILFLMPCVIFLSTGISLFFGYSAEQFSLTKEMSVMKGWAILGIAIPLLIAPLIEELGWRGYGVDSLRANFNLFNASLLFGVLWAAWHLPPFFVKEFYQNQLWNMGIVYVINFFLSCIVFAFLMNWVYYKTGRSIPAIVLLHGVANFSAMVLRTDQFTKCVATAVLCLIVIAVVACDKDFFFRKSYSPLNQNIQSELDRLRQKHGFPGATCAYVLRDGTIGEIASGVSDKETNAPMTTKSRMLAASIGKTFVGAAALGLAREGLIDLDASLSSWLGNREWFARLPNHDTITLRQLLTHSSGLPDHVHSPKFLENPISHKIQAGDFFSPESLIECILDQPALFEAGQGWSYTDTGYILLGLVIEAATGDDYYEVVKRRFLKPLNLDMTSPSDRPDLPGLIAGYTSPNNGFGVPPKTIDASGSLVWNPLLEWTGGGMISTSRDLAVWAKILYEGNAMQSDYLKDLFRGASIRGSDQQYGAGVVIQKSPLGDQWGHYGIIPGYVSSMRYYPKYGFAVAFQVNTDENVPDLLNDMEQSLAEIISQDQLQSSTSKRQHSCCRSSNDR